MRGMEAIQRGATKSWQIPLPIDSLLHYSILGSCYGCLLACLGVLYVPIGCLFPQELRFPFLKTTPEESTVAYQAPVERLIAVSANGTLTLDGRTMGNAADRKLKQLTTAILLSRSEKGNAPPLVIRVASQSRHGRLVEVLSALERAGSPDYVLEFEGGSAEESLWKGRK